MSQFHLELIKAAEFSPLSLEPPTAWCGHLSFASWLLRQIRPRILVELGTHTGNSYFSFCQTVKEEGLTTQCYAVDTWHGDEHAGYYGDEIHSQVSAHNQAYYSEFSTLLRMTFDKASPSFSPHSIDLLHIDGLHTYDAVRHDFETWHSRLAPQAIVLFHDTAIRDHGFGVWRFWDELKYIYPGHLEFTHSNGLGILQIGNSPTFPWLVPSSHEQLLVRNYFSALGLGQLERADAHALRQTIQTCEMELQDLRNKIRSLSSLRDAQSETIAQQEHEILRYATSHSWRFTSPMRTMASLFRRGLILTQMLKHKKPNLVTTNDKSSTPLKQIFFNLTKHGIRRLNRSIFPIYTIIAPTIQAHIEVEFAEIFNDNFTITGWCFFENNDVQNITVQFIHKNDIQTSKVLYGLHRSDVQKAFPLFERSGRSGFSSSLQLEHGIPDRIFLEVTPAHGPILRTKIHPRYKKISARQLGETFIHSVTWPKIQRVFLCAARGQWRYLYNKLRTQCLIHHNSVKTHCRLDYALELLSEHTYEPLPLPARVQIIIPVYNGFDHLQPLFESVLRTTPDVHGIIIIDDASPDQRIWPFLEKLAREYSNIHLLRNEHNLGFVGTVNKAASLCTENFVILNTDVVVPPGWLERLMNPIFNDKYIASTTPFSNAATICSFPEMNCDNPLAYGHQLEFIDKNFIMIRPDTQQIKLPTGVGFCMGINIAAWHSAGPFDLDAFGRGYGEENDWCQRALVAGYHHIIVQNLFVYHKHGGSFPAQTREALQGANIETLNARWPKYESSIQEFIHKDPLYLLRHTLTLLIICNGSTPKPILIVDHDLGGGATRYRRQLVDTRKTQGQPVLLLYRKQNSYLQPDSLTLSLYYNDTKIDFDVNDSSFIVNLFSYIPLSEIFYNGLVGYNRPLHTVSMLVNLKKLSSCKLTIAFHDYYPICPSYTLLDAKGHYNGPHDIDTVWVNIFKNPFSHNPLKNTREQWSTAWNELLSLADILLCFSDNSSLHLSTAYPTMTSKIVVQPHSLNWTIKRFPTLDHAGPLHIGVVGSISIPKGADIVTAIAKLLVNTDATARITVIGILENAPTLPNLHVTGPYKVESLPELLEELGINICLLPSICPETFSYVLEELMALSVPIVGFNVGATADRISTYQFGRICQEINALSALRTITDMHFELQRFEI